MRYTVKCNECARVFVDVTEKYGTMKYRCPYCGNVLTCRFDAPTAFRTRARSVLPLADATPVEVKKAAKLPIVETNILNTPSKEKLAEMREKLAEASHKALQASLLAGETLRNATDNATEFMSKSSSRLRKFQEKYEDGDLWIFFGFSLLFILSVLLCLFIYAEIVKVIADANASLFKAYIEFRNTYL